jgi:hypothetical protein
MATSTSNRAFCHFCGATVTEISERTDEIVSSIFDCPKCCLNYCDQCSYTKEINGKEVQLCLRCDSKLDKVE